MEELLQLAAIASEESAPLDFKRSFEPSVRDWCEFVKDIVAMANSGGGVIVFGVEDDGQPTTSDLSEIRKLDPAVITDKIYKYTDFQFADFSMVSVDRAGHQSVALLVGAVSIPVVFTQAGNYVGPDGKTKTAFSQGMVYFRHGAKSEPGNRDDLRNVLERELAAIRESWLSGIKKVVESAPGSTVAILPPEIRDSVSPDATPIRVTDDESVTAFRRIDTNATHPHRLKDIATKLNNSLGGVKVSTFDLQCVRWVHNIDANSRYFFQPRFASPRYSDAFHDWIFDQYSKDSGFFEGAKRTHKEQRITHKGQ